MQFHHQIEGQVFARMHHSLSRMLALLLLSFSPLSAFQSAIGEYGGLPRRGLLGISISQNDDGALYVMAVGPGSAAERASIRAGDVIISIDGETFAAPQAAANAISAHAGGDAVELLLARDGNESAFRVELDPRPIESHEGLKTVYDAANVGEYRVRTITIAPRAAGADTAVPAVLFLQGLTCSSLDNWTGRDDSYTSLVVDIARAGYAVMRVEKPGVGDSEGPACRDIGFAEESEAYKAALRLLSSYDFVDTENIVLFGHSMGGVFAPIVAAEDAVAGVAVYGTIGKPFIEYMVENTRRQDELAGVDLPDVETLMRHRLQLWNAIFERGLNRREVIEAEPALTRYANMAGFDDDEHIWGRSLLFFRELVGLNIAGAWQRISAPVLILHGEFDWVANRSDHKVLVEILRRSQNNDVTFKVIASTDHNFESYADLQSSYDERYTGPYSSETAHVFIAWLSKLEHQLKS